MGSEAPVPKDFQKPNYQGSGTLSSPAPSRRSFLGWLLANGTAGVSALLSVPLVRFLLYPLLAQTTETKWSEVGEASEFALISTSVKPSITVEQRDGWRRIVSEKPVYVTKDAQGRLRVLSAVCPHLGCSVPWVDGKQGFICPCHRAVFAPDGAKISGPAPRAMDELETQIQDGKLMVHYQYFRQLVPGKEVIG